MQATPISAALDLTTALGRLRALTASCNIWRLLAGYASQAPTVPLESGHIMRSPDGLRTCCLLQGTHGCIAAWLLVRVVVLLFCPRAWFE